MKTGTWINHEMDMSLEDKEKDMNFRDEQNNLKNENESLENQTNNPYRDLFDLTPHPKLIYEKGSLRIIEVNIAATCIYGYSKAEFRNLTLKELRPSTDWQALFELQNEVNEIIGIINFGVIKHLTKEGKEILINLFGHPITYFGKECILATGEDVTQKKMALAELKEKEEKLEHAHQIAKLGNWEYNLKNHALYCSTNALNLWDYSSDYNPTIGYFFNTVHPMDKKKLLLQILRKIQANEIFELNFRITTGNAEIKWITLVGAFKEGSDNILQGTVQDITQQKIELQRLRVLERVITHNADGVMITEAEPINRPGPHILFVNDAMCQISGYQREELIGKTPRIMQGPKTDKNALKSLKLAMKEWQSCSATVINYKKNGEEFYNQFSMTPVADVSGWYTHWIAIERDVTKNKITEMQKELMASISNDSKLKGSSLEFMIASLHSIASFGSFDLAEFWTRDETTSEFLLQAQVNLHLRSTHFPGTKKDSTNGYMREIIDRSSLKIWDISVENLDAFKGYRLLLGQQILGIPLTDNGKFLGMLLLGNKAAKGSLDAVELQIEFYDDLGKHLGQELQRKKLENALRISNERYEKLTEAANDAIYDCDLKTNEVYLGKGFQTIFGYDLHLPYSFDIWMERVHFEDRQSLLSKFEQILDNNLENDVFFNEYRYLTSSGKYANVIDRGLVIRNESGRPIRLLGAIRDISYRKEHEESLKRLNLELTQRAAELSRSNAELEQFAYVASHDLQEPLRMISSFLKLLEKRYKEKLDAKALEYISFAVDGASRMRKILLDLLEFSRAGESGSEKEKSSLNEVVDEACLLLRRKIQDKKAKIEAGNLPQISGYRSALVQVFFNLISNSIKYVRVGVSPVIGISAKSNNNFVEIHIVDNGIGIEPEYKDKIFEVFQRLHGKNEYEGTGMGLAIVKKIMESHNGSIALNPHSDNGAHFILRFPQLDIYK